MRKFLIIPIWLIFNLNSHGQVAFSGDICSCLNSSFGGGGYQILSADFNNDGKNDIAIVESDDSCIEIYLGNGAGNFSLSDSISLGTKGSGILAMFSIASGDFNGDGKIDLAVTKYISSPPNTDSIVLLFGNGDGSFSTPSSLPGVLNYVPKSILSADVNGDGKMDLIVSYDANNFISVYIGNGLGAFSAPLNSDIGQWPTILQGAISLADINGDGNIDLIAPGYYNSNILILLNDGSGNFSLDTVININSGTVTCADFNNDGRIDIATFSTTGIYILMNDSLGHFSVNSPIPVTCTELSTILSGDFNGDGKIDLAYTSCNNFTIEFLEGDGAGNFLASSNNYPLFFDYSSSTVSLIGSDFNDDGKMDIAAIGFNDSTSCYSINVILDNNTNTEIDYSPKFGGNGGYVTIHFIGDSVKGGMHLKFTSVGLPDIVVPDSNIFLNAKNNISAVVDLIGAYVGTYNVILTDSVGSVIQFNNGFEVTQFVPSNIHISTLGPDMCRAGKNNTFYFQLYNDGNCDALGVPLFIFVTGNNSINFPSGVQTFDGTSETEPLSTDLENYLGNEGASTAYDLLISDVPAGSSILFPIQINPLTPHQPFTVTGSTGPPIFNSAIIPNTNSNIPVDPNVQDCLNGIASQVLNIAEALANDPIKCAIGSVELYHNYFIGGENWQTVDFADKAVSTSLACAATVFPELKAVEAAKDYYDVLSTVKYGYDFGGNLSKCSGGSFNPFINTSTKNSVGLTSNDPNNKIGIGVGTDHYISGKEPLSYGILFENSDTASLPAQTVKIIDTLDIFNLDLSTFRPLLVQFGNNVINFPVSAEDNIVYQDLRPKINLIVKVEIKLNVTTGVLETDFTSLDPATMLPITNSLVGFLPPDTTSPQGEGSIYYSINPKMGLANNTQITNTAYIYFDANYPIQTPAWINKLDTIAPSSKMNKLPLYSNDTIITLNWQGIDDQSGVQKYDIYYSENNGTYAPIITNIYSTSATFVGKIGTSYSFYSIAIDSVNNKEVKDTAETKTTFIKEDVQLYPNPTNGFFTIQTKAGIVILEISLYDLQGRRLPIEYSGGNNSFQIMVTEIVPTGMYILQIETNEKSYNKKIFIEK